MDRPDIWFEREYVPRETVDLIQTNMYVDEQLTGVDIRPVGINDGGDRSPISPDVYASLMDQTISEERDERVQEGFGAAAWTAGFGLGSYFAIKEALDTSNSVWVNVGATVGGMVMAVAAAGGVAGIVGAATGRGFLKRRSGGQIAFFKQLKEGNAQAFLGTERNQGSQPSSPFDTL
jgi:hypothetical protein